MIRLFSLGLVLMVTWLLLSGHYSGLLISLGVASVILVVWTAHYKDVVDHEGHPVHLTLSVLVYWPWLLWEIIKSNIDVVKIILSPKDQVRPMIFRVPASQKSDVGLTTYANSITLTPGTITLDTSDGMITVHALTRAGYEGLQTGEMDRRVTKLEGLTPDEGSH